jgi:hypothetical protein
LGPELKVATIFLWPSIIKEEEAVDTTIQRTRLQSVEVCMNFQQPPRTRDVHTRPLKSWVRDQAGDTRELFKEFNKL